MTDHLIAGLCQPLTLPLALVPFLRVHHLGLNGLLLDVAFGDQLFIVGVQYSRGLLHCMHLVADHCISRVASDE